jgi:hypothetical protein
MCAGKKIYATRVISSVVEKYQAGIISDFTQHFLTPDYRVSATPGKIYSDFFLKVFTVDLQY